MCECGEQFELPNRHLRYKGSSAAVALTRALIGLNCSIDLVESDACVKPTRGTTANIVSGYMRLSGTDL